MKHLHKAMRIAILIFVPTFATACSTSARVPVLSLRDEPKALVCASGQIQFCERLSGFVWGRCDCVTVSR